MTDFEFFFALGIAVVSVLVICIFGFLITRGDEAEAEVERLRQNHGR